MSAPSEPATAFSRALLAKEQVQAEQRLAKVRVVVLAVVVPVVLFFSMHATGGDAVVQRRAILILLGGLAYAALWYWFQRGRRQRSAIDQFSSAIDLAIVLALCFNWSIYPGGEVLPTQARFAMAWGGLMLLLAVTAARLDWRSVLVVTAESLLGYGAYVLFLATAGNVHFTARTDESLAPGVLNAVDVGGRFFLLAMLGGLLAWLVHRVEGLLVRSVRLMEQKEHLRQFVTTNVVEEIEAGRASFDLSGRRRRVTVMFCDIRGFTPLSETMPAEQLLDLLNGYYEVLGSVILEHHGTLDKYMGDGIMALFGAPAPLENSSLSAVRCGQAMLAAVEAYGRKAGKDLRVGIGLHTSEVVVGNLGTASFKNYTAVGEGVNLAARIESATRQSDASLLFSAEVKASLPAEMAVRAVGDFSLKGVSRPVPLFALADERTG